MTYSGEPQDLAGMFASLAERVRALEARFPIPGLPGPAGPAGPAGPGVSLPSAILRVATVPALSASAAAMTLTPIPGGFKHLLVVWKGRGDTAAGNVTVLVRFNADSAGNYDYNRSSVTGAGAPADIEATGASAIVGGIMSASTAPTDVFGGGVLWIPDYAGPNNKFLLSDAVSKTANAAGGTNQESYGGWWRSNAIIVSVSLLPNAGNFIAVSKADAYALP